VTTYPPAAGEDADAMPAAPRSSRRQRAVVASKPAHRSLSRDIAVRSLVLVTCFAAMAAIANSNFEPWWRFRLYAPQYPSGLDLVISLNGVSGDVSEVNILNHYIGMRSLDQAAPIERQLASFAVSATIAVSLLLCVFAGRRITRLIAVPSIALPVLFVADSVYWLYSFGHDLNPRAPLRIGGFTPQMFGNGTIGQFDTFAQPGAGFWWACSGALLFVVAAWLRGRVCSSSGSADRCSFFCSRLLVLPGSKESTR
jgi:copper chaperone NosL